MEAVAAISALTTLIKAMSGWEFGVLIVLVIAGPVCLVAIGNRSNNQLRDEIKEQGKLDNKRFEAVVRMYENNATLAENYLKLANELMMVIHLNTEAMTKLVARIDNQHFVAVERRV